MGRPQPAGLGELVGTSAGIDPRGKNHINMPVSFHCRAYTPPPAAANGAPYEGPGTAVKQP